MTDPRPPLFSADFARQTTLIQILHVTNQTLAIVTGLQQKVASLMSEDATAAAQIADIDAKVTAAMPMLASVQALLVSLQAEVAAGSLSPETQAALAQAQADTDTFAAALSADEAADIPPAPPAGP